MSASDAFEIVMLFAILATVLSRNDSGLRGFGHKKTALVLDSCGLIDGRIEQMMAANILQYELVIPDYILLELQNLADSKNSQKRLRAVQGLDVARRLQSAFKVRTHATQVTSDRSIDGRLLNTCKVLKATLYTNDVPLTQLAALQRIPTININEISMLLRPTVIPGVVFTVMLLRKGDNRNQAIGYTDDGSMVVVDAVLPKYVGKQVVVKVKGLKDTTSGRIIFAAKQ